MKIHCAHDKLVKIKELKPHPENANKHSTEQIERLAKILEYQGWRYPIKVSKQSGFITSGHGRLAAAIFNKWKEVPVNFQDYDSDEQEYADVQSDNAIASWAELDLSKINAQLEHLGPDFDIDLLGIKDFVLEPAEKLDPGCEEDEIPEKVEPKTKLGDLYILGKHRLLCGDSTNIQHVEQLMNGQKADMVFTDPPYGIAYKSPSGAGKTARGNYDVIAGDDSKNCAREALGVAALIAPDAVKIFWGANHYASSLPTESACWLVWDKRDGEQINNNSDCELAWCSAGGSARLFHHKWNGMIKASEQGERRSHPTQKPVALAEWAFDLVAPSSVLDLFGGSGSTLIACEKTKRQCFMMELDPHYCDVIVARWEKYTGKKAKLNGSSKEEN